MEPHFEGNFSGLVSKREVRTSEYWKIELRAFAQLGDPILSYPKTLKESHELHKF